MTRVLVVDDEQMARERLRMLLEPFDELEIVGEAKDGPQALERIAELRPDLVFLDIEMPGLNGLELVASMPSPRPRVVYCTAYDQYAVDAFELEAVDYLLKPVNRSRLEKAVRRALERGPGDRDDALDRAGRRSAERTGRFLAKKGARYHVIPRDDVVCFTSEDGLTCLQTGDGRYWMQPTLGDLEQRLDPGRFFRVSRSAIVHLDRVAEVIPLGGGHGELRMRNDLVLEISRRRFKELMDRLGHPG